jgi:hypothetical protein
MQQRRRHEILTMVSRGESLFGRVKAEEIFRIEPLLQRTSIHGGFYALTPAGKQDLARLNQPTQEAA